MRESETAFAVFNLSPASVAMLFFSDHHLTPPFLKWGAWVFKDDLSTEVSARSAPKHLDQTSPREQPQDPQIDPMNEWPLNSDSFMPQFLFLSN